MRRPRRSGIALLLPVALLAACVEETPHWRPLPLASSAPSDACVHARDLRARVPGLLDEGRLDRAVRVMQRAEDLCPVETEATWAQRVTALAKLGRAAEAMQLVRRIEISDRATDEDRRAAAAARAVAEEQARLTTARGGRRDDPELFDPSEKDRAAAAATFRRGALAERAGDHAGAKRLFLEAWQTWHPYPRALVEAGLAAAALGEKAEAHTLWDRAAYDDTTTALRPEVADGVPESIAPVTPVAWSPKSDRLAVGGRVEVAVYDAHVVPLFRLRTPETAVALAFSVDGAQLFAALDGGRIVVFDLATGTVDRELAGHRGAGPRPGLRADEPPYAPGPVRLIAPSPDRRTLATTGEDGTLRLWDLEAGGVPKSVPLPHGATAIAWSPDAALLGWAGEDRRITLWDVKKGAPAATLAARAGAVRAMAWFGDALAVVTATERLSYDLARPRLPPKVVARERADEASFAPAAPGDRRGLAVVAGGEVSVQGAAVDFSAAAPSPVDRRGFAGYALAPAGRALALVRRDRTLDVVQLESGAPSHVKITRPPPLGALAVASDGKTLAAAADDGWVHLWSSRGFAPTLPMVATPGEAAPTRFRSIENAGLVRALAFSPDGKTLAMGLASGLVELADPAGEGRTVTFSAQGGVRSLAFSPDGTRLAAATDASMVLVFEAATQALARELRLAPGPARAARFLPDGRALILASKEGVVRWDLDRHDGVPLPLFGPDPRDVAVTPDGTGLAVADARGILMLGKPAAAAQPPPVKIGVPSQALALAVARSGSIATAEGDRAITLRTAEGKPMARFREPDGAVRDVSFLGTGLVVATFSDGSARIFRAPATTAAAVLRPVPEMRATLVLSGGGLVDLAGEQAGPARAAVRCRLGPALYPFDVCADQFEVPGILQIVLAGQDPAEADP